MYYNLRKVKPEKRKSVWGIKECSVCMLMLDVIRYMNFYLRKCGFGDLCVVPVEVYKREGHVIDVGLEFSFGRLRVWSLHVEGMHGFMKEVCGLVANVVGVAGLLNEGSIQVMCGGNVVWYRLKFSNEEFGLRVRLPSGEVCEIKGVEETIKFLVSFAIMLYNSQEEVSCDV